jgi:hypothetical protein
VLYNNINGYIENRDITPIWSIVFLINMIMAFQHVAIDAWMVTLLEEDKRIWGGYGTWFGQRIGWVIGKDLFMLIHSMNWLNKNIFTENPIEEPLGIPFLA